MDAPHTVVILGAGSSFDYGFPLGDELMVRLRDELLDPSIGSVVDSPEDQSDAGKLKARLKEIPDRLPLRLFDTVDQFLDGASKETRSLLRLAMAYTFLRLERNHVNTVRQRDTGTDWYVPLWDHLKDASDEEIAGIRFLSFNYERSCEFDLWRFARLEALRSGSQRWDNFPLHIQHVHGCIGGCDGGSFSRLLPSSPLSADEIRAGAQSLVTFSDAGEDRWVEPRRSIAHAERLVFIGFGFHTSNLANLGITSTGPAPSWRTQKQVYATGVAFEGDRRVDAEKRLGTDIHWSSGGASTLLAQLGNVFRKPGRIRQARANYALSTAP